VTDTVALITGAGSGIGRGVVERFVADGARVAAMDIAADRVQALRDEFGDAVLPVAGDVSTWESNRDAVAATVEHFGRLDVFIGNAGISDNAIGIADVPGDQIGTAFDELFGVNVKACILGVRAALDPLLASRGCVILTASFASFFPAGGGVFYTPSKHAVLGLVRQLAYELAPDVRVNGVAPGLAPTALGGLGTLGQAPMDSVLPGSELNLPMQAIPSAESYAGTFAFLASRRDAGHITGTVVSADSGLSIRGIAKPSARSGR
jgi:NAD(P)-dependent dehydrogenase (short-subunit alcohol dehydrogenase family)